MDKVAYHYNKKKIPAETAGKYLYYYPCDDPEKVTAWLEGHGFSVLEVSEKEWEALFELDQLEYNSHHKYARHTTPMPEEAEDELPDGEQERLHTEEIPVSETVAEKVDKQALVSKLSEKEQQYLNCLDQGLTQKQVAKQFGVSQGYVSIVKQQAQYNLDYKEYRAALKNNDPEFVWKCWDRFSRKMEMPVFLDIELDYVIGCLHPDDVAHFLYWYYSIGELIRYTLTYYDYRSDKRTLLCHTEFWRARGGKMSYSELQERFYNEISKRYGAKRGESHSRLKYTAAAQKIRWGRVEGDSDDVLPAPKGFWV